MPAIKPILTAFRLLVPACLVLCVTTQAVTELPKLLQSGKILHDIDSSLEGDIVYRIDVPAGADSLEVTTSGGSGDCDVYTRHGAHPTTQDYDGSSEAWGNTESVVHSSPEPGTWFVLLHAYESFRGLRLRVKVSLPPMVAAAPTFTPAPGVFTGAIRVALRSKQEAARIYYTTDGTEPTQASHRYRRPLSLEASETLRAVAFHRGHASSEVEAAYSRKPAGAESLASGIAATHLSGNNASFHLFKIVVPTDPGGQPYRLHVETAGGNGDTLLYLRRGAPPTVREFDRRANGSRNLASIVVEDAEPGEWFVGVRGMSDFSNVSVIANLVLPVPDLVVWEDSLEPYISTETFDPEDCTVVEGHALAGERRLLRFSTESRNIGGEDIVLGTPEDHPDWFEYHECHGHYHFLGFASYRLLDLGGNVAATGRKVSFCLEDIVRWSDAAAEESKYTCEYQGIQAGWSDIYSSGLEGQWVDITDVPPGDYLLEVTLNPDHLLLEGDYSNNTTTIPVTIPAP